MFRTLERFRRNYRQGTLDLAIQGEIGGWISKFGEWIGLESLVYNPWTFAIFHRAALEIAPTFVTSVQRHLPEFNRVADFGCGTGVYIAEFQDAGIEAEGFEYSPVARQWAEEEMGLKIHPFDLTSFSVVGRRFDVSMSIEVAEHLHEETAHKLVEICCKHAPTVLFSAASPGQDGVGHINLKPKSYWIDQFEQRGYTLNKDCTQAIAQDLQKNLDRGFWVADNIGVYEEVENESFGPQESRVEKSGAD